MPNMSCWDEILHYTENPTFYDLAYGTYKTIRWYYSPEMMENYSFPMSFFADVRKSVDVPTQEFLPVIYIAIQFTIVRYIFEYFCKILVKWLNFDVKSDAEKFPESVWKGLVYTFMWSYLYYLLVASGRYNYLKNPPTMWDHWSFKMDVPYDIKLIYLIECGFYVHSVYATIYMDVKRRDYKLMLLHHIVTILLIVFSYSLRYHRVGLVVLFCHDVNDILLEYTKCNVYLRKRNGRFYRPHERITEQGFAAFLFTWCVTRLYWFPLKVIYTVSVTAASKAYHLGATFLLPFMILLGILLLLNVYWFYLISLIVFKKLIGQLSDSSDIREDDENDKPTKKNA